MPLSIEDTQGKPAAGTPTEAALKPGEVVQIDLKFPSRCYAGVFVYVHEVMAWGIAGVVMAPRRHGEAPHAQGASFPNGSFVRIGKAEWALPMPALPSLTVVEKGIADE